jgi:hypothetical protein
VVTGSYSPRSITLRLLLKERNTLVNQAATKACPWSRLGAGRGGGIVFQFEQSPTFWRFGEWKAVFRRTTGEANPPLFRPL